VVDQLLALKAKEGEVGQIYLRDLQESCARSLQSALGRKKRKEAEYQGVTWGGNAGSRFATVLRVYAVFRRGFYSLRRLKGVGSDMPKGCCRGVSQFWKGELFGGGGRPGLRGCPGMDGMRDAGCGMRDAGSVMRELDFIRSGWRVGGLGP
jgi:hypothetical protein